jgi:circadian clock protein KaiB
MKPPLEPFKAIALFTPGGDFAYCKDTEKHKHWHVHLCSALQEALNLSEAPHFLLHGYKATVDVYWNPTQNQLQINATAMPAILQYRGLLNYLFQIPGTRWQVDTINEALCDPQLLKQYRHEFPQLWEFHDLMIPVMQRSIAQEPFSAIFSEPLSAPSAEESTMTSIMTSIPLSQDHQPPQATLSSHASKLYPAKPNSTLPLSGQTEHLSEQFPEPDRYILRLFVAHQSASTEAALRSLHRVLERSHLQPYTLQVIDISKYPEQAERDQVTATPTLLRVQPTPARRIVGSLENDDQLLHLLVGLDLADYA